jgi:hypothetical protein
MDTSKTENKIKCSLCGAIFEPDSNTCGGCALNKDCKLICCPNCGFGIPGESKLSKWLKKKHEKQGSE